MNDKLTTQFGWFKIEKVGRVNLYCEQLMPTAVANLVIKIKEVVADLPVGAEVFLTVDDQSVRNEYGAKIILVPTKLIAHRDSITPQQQNKIDAIIVRTANEYLDQGFYRGYVIDYAANYLINSDSDPELKSYFVSRVLKNIRKKLEQPKLSKEQYIEYFKYYQSMYLKYASYIQPEQKAILNRSLSKHKVVYKNYKIQLNRAKKQQKINAAVEPLILSNKEKRESIKDIAVNSEHYNGLLKKPLNAALTVLKEDERLARLVYALQSCNGKSKRLPKNVEELKFFIKFGRTPFSKASKNKNLKKPTRYSVLDSQIITSQLFALKIVKAPNPHRKDKKGRIFISFNFPNLKEMKKIIDQLDQLAALPNPQQSVQPALSEVCP